MTNLPHALDEHEIYMVAATGYFVDVVAEDKYFLISEGEYVRTGATQAEMLLWSAWLTSLRSTKQLISVVTGRIETLVTKLELASKATPATNSVDPT